MSITETVTRELDAQRARRPRMAYIPGSVQFTFTCRERRTPTYRTWHSPHPDMAWGVECLLCGEWDSGHTDRESAEWWGSGRHPHWCHVRLGCHCREPHLTAADAARLGITGEYPAHLGAVLLRMAGGTRKYRAPIIDRNGNSFC